MLARQLKVHDEVRRVSSCRKGTSTGQDLVTRTVVDVSLLLFLSLLDRLEPHHRIFGVQLLGPGLPNLVSVVVPSRALHEQTPNVASIRRRLLGRLNHHVVHDVEVPRHGVDRELEFTGVVLHGTSQESLREEESGEPEHRGWPTVDPVVDKLRPLEEIHHPCGQRLHGRVCLTGPHVGNLVVKDGITNGFQIWRHNHKTLERLQ
mmetsp:Transcript_25260/g.30582  ORF Transcript_25260/g.30582 Transcript_25260/m.30582 type:complete len:205 (-) Transcript_25260:4251-4865(-)